MSLKQLIPDPILFPEAKVPQLRIESWSNSARTLQLRGFTKDQLISHDHTTNADRSVASDDFDISDVPLMLQVSPSTGPVRRGECYVRITLLMAGFPVGRLITAYLTDGKTLTWPPGVHEGFTEGPGYLRALDGTNPAAASEISEAVPTNARWKLKGLRFQLVADANVADRRVFLIIDDGATPALHVFVSQTVQTAGLTRQYYFAPYNYQPTAQGSEIYVPIVEEIILFQGFRIRTSTTNLQAGDDYAAPTLLVEEWIEE